MKRIRIVQDQSPESPREWDNLGTMLCVHNRYDLGDSTDINHNDFDSWAEMEKHLYKKEDAAIVLPLYLYDHSGITISTGSFSCRFDSGQIGFIYISRAKILKEYGRKIVTKALKEKVTTYLEGEVKTYDQYLTGEVYGFIVEEATEMVKLSREEYEAGVCDNVESETEWAEIDSCWGFYGDDFLTNGVLDYAGEEFKEQLKNIEIEY
jgi:hypothetical protein